MGIMPIQMHPQAAKHVRLGSSILELHEPSAQIVQGAGTKESIQLANLRTQVVKHVLMASTKTKKHPQAVKHVHEVFSEMVLDHKIADHVKLELTQLNLLLMSVNVVHWASIKKKKQVIRVKNVLLDT